MRGKTLLVLAAVCVLLAAVAYLNIRPGRIMSGGPSEIGARPFAGLPVNDIVAVTIVSAEDTVLLRRGTPVWKVDNRFGYPANFGKIADLVRGISDVKTGRTFQADRDALARMQLMAPEKTDLPAKQRGVRVILRDADDTVHAEIIVGRPRETVSGFGGNYLLDVRNKVVHLVDRSFASIEKKPGTWLDGGLLEVRSADVAQVVCMEDGGDPAQPLYRLARPGKDLSPQLDPPEDAALNDGVINSLFGALDGLTIRDVADPDADLEAVFTNKPFLEYRLFDGVAYRIFPGPPLSDAQQDLYYLRIAVDYETPSDADAAAAETSPAEKSIDPATVRARAAEQQQRIGAWTYVVDQWRHQRFITAKAGLMKTEE